MQTLVDSFDTAGGELDFAAMLEASFAEDEQAERGDLVSGVVLAVDNYGLIVDVGLKRDGIVPRRDLDPVAGARVAESGPQVVAPTCYSLQAA